MNSEKKTVYIALLLAALLLPLTFSPISAQPDTVVYVDPKLSIAEQGESFNVTIKIINVADLNSYQFYLAWHAPLLNVTQYLEGDFLSEGGVRKTLPINKTYNDQGVIKVWNTRLGGGGGVFGSGLLDIITFSVEGSGGSGLYLYNVRLLDSYNNDIQNVVVEDGYFFDTDSLYDVSPELKDYDELLANYTQLKTDYDELLANYTQLQTNHDSMQSSYNSLQTTLSSLNSTYNSLRANYSSLQIDFDELESKYNDSTGELGTSRNLNYILVATTIIFVATTVLFATRKPKIS